ncbi:MAG: nucleotidyl transferase AbiEii/AbiGii toxin family protein [Candidatus Omnitrophica bacterium]|nr:nucleotidyl transferase AbiEii/AbiGii toxin family protein [Candidatus Omnitrophota bacterium]
MKDYIKELVDANVSENINLNRVREYLQEYILYIIYKKKIYKELVFCGGTALRFFYKIKRFSEDIDFSLSSKVEKCDFENLLKLLKEELTAAGYIIDVKYSTSTNVYSAFFKFSGLLFEYGISPHKDKKISIKMEIDTNPPAGGVEEVTLYNSTFMFYTLHYDLPSLLAGKTHALLCRNYVKGRDWYDLLWYLTKFKNLEPNFSLLNNALLQTQADIEKITPENWKNHLNRTIDKIDFNSVGQDVYRFLEDPEEKELLTKENFYKILDS